MTWTHRTTAWIFLILSGLLTLSILTQTWALVGLVLVIQSLILLSLIFLPYRTR